jgi:hypothetical protein
MVTHHLPRATLKTRWRNHPALLAGLPELDCADIAPRFASLT